MKPEELADLLLKNLRDYPELHYLARTFTGAKEGTFDVWIRGGSLIIPRGQRLNKLWHFMVAAGMCTSELEEVPVYGRYLSQLLAYDLVDLAKARQYCGDVVDAAVLAIIRGQSEPETVTTSLKELTNLHEKELRKRMENLKKAIAEVRSSSESRQGVSTPILHPVQAGEPGVPKDTLVHIASVLGTALPYVRFALKHCSDEERATIRELIGPEALFELSNGLNQLNGVRAFNYTRGGKQQ